VEVLKSGKVGRINMVTSSGFDVLDKAALEAVKGWRFIPGTRNGNRTRQWVVVPVRFRLQ
ncbi:MAG: energy transducer TonB, partial [Deltaproteobacteria bacterium]|nr:energy transducer TonB [Deltaproteobacteria bacterium]